MAIETKQEIEVKIEINTDLMVLDDLEALEAAKGGEFSRLLATLDRIAVVEGVESVRQLPLYKLREVVQAIHTAMVEVLDAGN
jgi:hypothetical protein